MPTGQRRGSAAERGRRPGPRRFAAARGDTSLAGQRRTARDLRRPQSTGRPRSAAPSASAPPAARCARRGDPGPDRLERKRKKEGYQTG